MGGELHYQIAEQEKQQDYEELKRDYGMLSKIYNHDDHADYFELRRHDDGFRITVHLPCGFNIHELRSYCSIYGYWIHDDRSSETPTDEHHRTFTLLYDSALTSTGTVEEITVDLIHLRDYRNYVIRNDAGRRKKMQAMLHRTKDLDDIYRRVQESKYLCNIRIDSLKDNLTVHGSTVHIENGKWTGVNNTYALKVYKKFYRTGPDQSLRPSERRFRDPHCTITCDQDLLKFEFVCTHERDPIDCYERFERNMITFLTDMNEAAEWRLDFTKRETLETNLKDHEEEPDTSGDDDYPGIPPLEDPNDTDPVGYAEDYLGMSNDQLRYIENNNYIIDTGNAFENDFGMTGVDLDNVDFIDDGDNYDDPEATEQPSNSDKRNSSNTELDFEYTQDVD